MFLVDITYPPGVLAEEARAAIAEQVATGLLGGPAGGGAEATMRRARSMTHVVFHSAESWTTGDGPPPAAHPPPYLVTITVPDAWRRDISEHAIRAVHDALLAHDPIGEPARPGGDVWINVVGVRDGSIGLGGRACSAEDVVMFMTDEHRANPEPVDLPAGVVADPICGMHVTIDDDAITLTHNGETLGFCSKGCRSAYTRDRGPSGNTR